MVVLASFFSILFITNSLPVYTFRIRRHPEVARRLVIIISPFRCYFKYHEINMKLIPDFSFVIKSFYIPN